MRLFVGSIILSIDCYDNEGLQHFHLGDTAVIFAQVPSAAGDNVASHADSLPCPCGS